MARIVVTNVGTAPMSVASVAVSMGVHCNAELFHRVVSVKIPTNTVTITR